MNNLWHIVGYLDAARMSASDKDLCKYLYISVSSTPSILNLHKTSGICNIIFGILTCFHLISCQFQTFIFFKSHRFFLLQKNCSIKWPHVLLDFQTFRRPCGARVRPSKAVPQFSGKKHHCLGQIYWHLMISFILNICPFKYWQ